VSIKLCPFSGSNKGDDPTVVRRRLEQSVGSNAGSGSGAFHVYREHRRTEMDRIEQLEREAEEAKLKEEFAVRLEAHAGQDKARLERNQRRRKQRKVAKASKEGGDEDEAVQEDPDAKRQPPSADGRQEPERSTASV
jgi:hypothetical protein